MSKLLGSAVFPLTWAILFLFAGFVYETSYFIALDLSALSTLSVKHYIYSGFMVTVVPAVMVGALALMKKFFSKNIDRDDSKAFVNAAKDIGFRQSLSMARLVLLFCVTIWLFAIFEDRVFATPRVWSAVPWLSLFVMQAFFFALYTSPPQSRVAVSFAFVVAISLCISVWAIGSARLAKEVKLVSGAYIRDDAVVRIARTKGVFTAEAKSLELPLPFLSKLVDAVSGNPN